MGERAYNPPGGPGRGRASIGVSPAREEGFPRLFLPPPGPEAAAIDWAGGVARVKPLVNAVPVELGNSSGYHTMHYDLDALWCLFLC